ncbi:MAG: caspase family protein [Bacteroidia bacterium]|nr:caspase family protein [Bacteroidia bacterium]
MRYIRYTALCGWLMLACSTAVHAQNKFDELGRKVESSVRRVVENIERYGYEVSAGYLNNRAAYAFGEGQFEEARDAYSEVLRYYAPSDHDRLARTYYKRGLCYYILQQYAEAADDFTRAGEYRPDVPDPYYFRGKIRHLVWNQTSLAAQDFEETLRRTEGISAQTAFARYFLGDIAGAAAEVERLQAEARNGGDPLDAALLEYNLAGLQALIGNADRATAHLKTALAGGFDQYRWLERDINFRPIARNAAFIALLDSYHLEYQAGAGPALRMPERLPQAGAARGMAPALLSIREIRFEDADGNRALDAGESAVLSCIIANEGQGTAGPVQVRLAPVQGGRVLAVMPEAQVASIAPGTSAPVRLELTALETLEDGELDFRLEVREQNGYDTQDQLITLTARAQQPPRLEIPDHHIAHELGGNFTPGLPVTLRIAVQNTGGGPARAVQVWVRTPGMVFLTGDSVQMLGDLAAGEHRVVDIEFFASRRFTGSEVALKVEVREQSGRFGTRQTFRATINQPLEALPRVVIRPTGAPAQEVTYDQISLTSDVDRNLPRAAALRPDAIAVVIGNRDYRNPDVPPVDFALQDAASMKKYLIEALGYLPENIFFLPNASLADFNRMFGAKGDAQARLFNLVKPGVTEVFIYYSGHGAPDVQTGEPYFVPSDCDPSLVRFNGYAVKTFYENLSQLPAKSVTVAVDACFSGMTDRGALIQQASPVRIRTDHLIFKDPKAVVLTSAGSAEIASWYAAQSHGLFTYYLLKGLQGAADTDQNREISVQELRSYLGAEVPLMARRLHNRVQSPEVYGAAGAVVAEYE